MRVVPRIRARWRARAAAATLPVLLLTAFAPAPAALHLPPSAPADSTTRQAALSPHVVVISIDGLRPDAIAKYRARTIQRLMREGSYSLQAKTILPSLTLPSHTSMLTGVEPAVHGIDWNTEQMERHGHVQVPTIFSVAQAAGLQTAAFFAKSKFHHLELPGSLDHAQYPAHRVEKTTSRETIRALEKYLQRERPNLLFVHIGEPDYAGHVFGWMSFAYGWAVETADEAVDEVLEEADRAFGEGNYTVILTADHGGHGRGHGSDDPRDVTIPWVSWGRGVEVGTVLPAGIRTMDTAATALWLLGLRLPEPHAGSPVIAAFAPEFSARGLELVRADHALPASH